MLRYMTQMSSMRNEHQQATKAVCSSGAAPGIGRDYNRVVLTLNDAQAQCSRWSEWMAAAVWLGASAPWSVK